MYTTGVAARIGGVSRLTRADGYLLIRGEVAQIRKFKNVVACGVQSITLSEPAQEVLSFFLQSIRPACVRRSGNSDSPSSPLWLGYEGNRLTENKLGYYLTSFFRGKCNLQLSSDTCRALIETHAHEQQLAGHVSASENAAITSTNNHSSGTMKKYYLYEDSKKLARVGQVAMQRYLPIDKEEEDKDEDEDEEGHEAMEDDEPPREDDDEPPRRNSVIGSRHSVPANSPKAHWDEKELTHLNSCIEQVRAGYSVAGVLTPHLMRDCLRIILHDDEARAIYHPRHVLNSARLRAGYEALLRRPARR